MPIVVDLKRVGQYHLHVYRTTRYGTFQRREFGFNVDGEFKILASFCFSLSEIQHTSRISPLARQSSALEFSLSASFPKSTKGELSQNESIFTEAKSDDAPAEPISGTAGQIFVPSMVRISARNMKALGEN
jgi:hypothetical protein